MLLPTKIDIILLKHIIHPTNSNFNTTLKILFPNAFKKKKKKIPIAIIRSNLLSKHIT